MEKRKRDAEARERAQQNSSHPTTPPRIVNEPPKGASGFYFPALVNTAQESSSTTEQVEMKEPEGTNVSLAPVTSEIKKNESVKETKPELKTKVRQEGMETEMFSANQDHSELSSDPDWAQPDPSSYAQFPSMAMSPSYTPSFMTHPHLMTDATGLTDEEQDQIFQTNTMTHAQVIQDHNLNFADVVRFGGSSPTPAEMLQMNEDREAAVNLTLQMQMEIDFPTYIPSSEPLIVTLDAEEAQAIPEKELAQVIPKPDENNGNVVPIKAATDHKTNFEKYFSTEHKVQKEEFKPSKAQLRKSKKAQKKALKSAKN
jgi:hypothetical protein